jgi:hypothetical protein
MADVDFSELADIIHGGRVQYVAYSADEKILYSTYS